MNLKQYVEDQIKHGELKQEQLAVLNYVKQKTSQGLAIVILAETEWGNIPPIILKIFEDREYFEQSYGLSADKLGYFGLSKAGEEYREQLQQELEEK